MKKSYYCASKALELMIVKGGRVTNHELVKSFKRWLTDPALKEQARLQFKVNLLSHIKYSISITFVTLKHFSLHKKLPTI